MMNETKLFKYRPNAYHHVTFSTKRRKKVLVGEIKERVHFWFEELAREHNIQLEEYNTWLDHVHMLIFVGVGEDLSYFMNILIGGLERSNQRTTKRGKNKATWNAIATPNSWTPCVGSAAASPSPSRLASRAMSG
jgi:REP element-mobilizing transposase RayT